MERYVFHSNPRSRHTINDSAILVITDIFSLRRKEKIDPVFIKFCNLATNNLQSTIHKMVLLCKALSKNSNSGGNPPFRELTGVLSSLFIVGYFSFEQL